MKKYYFQKRKERNIQQFEKYNSYDPSTVLITSDTLPLPIAHHQIYSESKPSYNHFLLSIVDIPSSVFDRSDGLYVLCIILSS